MRNCYNCADAQSEKCLTCRTNENLDVSIRHGVTYPVTELPRGVEPATDNTRLEIDALRLVPATETEKALQKSVSALAEFAVSLTEMDFATFAVVRHLLRGGRYETADQAIRAALEDLGKWTHWPMSRQTAWARVKSIAKKHPWLSKVVHVVTRHLKSRKPNAVTRIS